MCFEVNVLLSMASLTSATSDGHYIPVVLRVKRKRTGDPVEALGEP